MKTYEESGKTMIGGQSYALRTARAERSFPMEELVIGGSRSISKRGPGIGGSGAVGMTLKASSKSSTKAASFTVNSVAWRR